MSLKKKNLWFNWETLKIILELKKKRSPYKILFLEDPEDPWFILVCTIKNKGNSLEYFTIITKNDLDSWISYKKSEGYANDNS
jgi:hypothetical protein